VLQQDTIKALKPVQYGRIVAAIFLSSYFLLVTAIEVGHCEWILRCAHILINKRLRERSHISSKY
jgi:hypothetical protein